MSVQTMNQGLQTMHATYFQKNKDLKNIKKIHSYMQQMTQDCAQAFCITDI
jgi:hypothetical protein